MIQSIADKLSPVLAPLKRKLFDLNISLYGTKTQVLRIITGKLNNWGASTETFDKFVIDNAIVKHPWGNNIQIFGAFNQATMSYDTMAIDLWDLLPIEIRIPFVGDTDDKPVALDKGDILIECLRDEHGNKIPIIMEVTRGFGGFNVKYKENMRYDCTLYRGTPNTEIRNIINLYLNSIE